ncbi:hypothetical protein [Galbibacter orientalis]
MKRLKESEVEGFAYYTIPHLKIEEGGSWESCTLRLQGMPDKTAMYW